MAQSREQPREDDDARKAFAPLKGRGAASRVAGRFEKRELRGEDDGWGSVYEGMDEASRPRTTVTIERARSIVSRNQSPDIAFSQSVNPYRGCEHGCVYCLVPETPVPSADTLHLMREVVAPQLAEVYPQFAQRVFGVAVIPAERSESRNP